MLVSVLSTCLEELSTNWIELKILVPSPSSSKILSSRKQHKKVFNGLILLWVLEKLLSNQLVGVDSFKASLHGEMQVYQERNSYFFKTLCGRVSEWLHHSCSPQRGRWMQMAPLRSSFFTWKNSDSHILHIRDLYIRDGLSVTPFSQTQAKGVDIYWAGWENTRWGLSSWWFPMDLGILVARPNFTLMVRIES